MKEEKKLIRELRKELEEIKEIKQELKETKAEYQSLIDQFNKKTPRGLYL